MPCICHTMSSILFLLCCLVCFSSNTMALAAAEANKSEIDRQSLLCFKSGIDSDPLGILTSWMNNSINFCRWQGVTCGSRIPVRVVSLGLSSSSLSGQIAGCIANLTSLSQIKLTDNQLSGAIPEELGTLQHLQTLMLAGNRLEGNIPDSLGTSISLSYVNLANNSLTGGIPLSLANSSSLNTLILSRNNLTGEIPATLFANSSTLATVDLQMNSLTGVIPPFGKVTALKYVSVTENFLSGSIPPSIGNVSSLHSLFLGQNKFTGLIPGSLSHNPKLIELDLSFNGFSGHVPLSLYNMSLLKYFNLGSNGLIGQLPPDVGHSLPNLQFLIMQSNKLDGLIPTSLRNVSNLRVLDLSNNSLHGLIPSFGSLPNLHQVLLGRNRLEAHHWAFLASLINCTQLTKLSLERNMLNGSLPMSVSNLSTNLEHLALGSNKISGSIPVEISNLANLSFLSMENNLLSGSIPPTIGKLRNLYILDLSKNKLSGQIPSSIGNITQLGNLFLGDNILSGDIPSSLGRCLGLLQLNLSFNGFDGVIPEQLFAGSFLPLSVVDLSHNNITGNIPAGFRALTLIQFINLSRNELFGNVTEFFNFFPVLEQLDLSYNNLEGPIPTNGILTNSTRVHLDGNKGLCSDFSMLALPPCHGISDNKTKIHKKHMSLLAVVVPSFAIPFLLLLFCLVTLWKDMKDYISALHSEIHNLLHAVAHWTRKEFSKFPKVSTVMNALCCITPGRRSRGIHAFTSYDETLKTISYADVAKATNRFSPVHRISLTRTGSVYVGRFNSGLVAIKVFNLNESGVPESYLTECEMLRSTRHRNILKAVTLCSTLDRQNNEFKALVLQYMANGSLERWLHPKQQRDRPERALTLGQRICIALDVASALDYLHNQLTPPLVHCDLKPSNILLDYDMTARVGDFGSAKFLPPVSSCLKHVFSVRGTIGYLAPEYGMGCRTSTEGDVYSFGVLLLEMLTGKKPIDEMFIDGLSLHKFSDAMFPDRVAEILDPHMVQEDDQLCQDVLMQSYVIQLVALGLSCSMESTKHRPGMQDVCAKLCAIKKAYLEC